jgi:hypothetical protein
MKKVKIQTPLQVTKLFIACDCTFARCAVLTAVQLYIVTQCHFNLSLVLLFFFSPLRLCVCVCVCARTHVWWGRGGGIVFFNVFMYVTVSYAIHIYSSCGPSDTATELRANRHSAVSQTHCFTVNGSCMFV